MTYVARNTPETANVSESNKTSGQNFLDQLAPQSALIVGLISSILVICTIGFIVLLIAYFGN